MNEQNKYLMRLCVSQELISSTLRDRCKYYDRDGLPIKKEKKKKFPITERMAWILIIGMMLISITQQVSRAIV